LKNARRNWNGRRRRMKRRHARVSQMLMELNRKKKLK